MRMACYRKGQIVYVSIDRADFGQLREFRWHIDSKGYAVRNVRVDGRQVKLGMHRQIMGLAYGDPQEVDHKNRNPLDNRRSNLFFSTRRQNANNTRSHGKSRFRGVASNHGKWRAYAYDNGKQINLGNFDTEDEAGAVADEYRKRNYDYSFSSQEG